MKLHFVLASTTALGAIIAPAVAQTAVVPTPRQDGATAPAARQSPDVFGDIVVVARRRAESLQSVPVAVTAVTGEALQSQNITTMLDLPRVSPGLHSEPSGGASRNLPLYSIRGQQQGEFLASTDPSVGIYWGDILVHRYYGTDFNIFDLNQIEVLKGPQGTLFGRNTTGGNIIFRPNTPTDNFEGGAFFQYGSFNQMQAQAHVNVPLAEGIALRLAANYKYQDGFITNVNPGPVSYANLTHLNGQINRPVFSRSTGASGTELGGERGAGLRASLKIESGPFENLTVGTYTTRNTGGSGYRLTALKPGSFAERLVGLTTPGELAASQALPFDEVRQNWQGYTKMPYSWTLANTTSYDLTDDITLKNIFGYHRFKARNFEDIDGSTAQLISYAQNQLGYEISDELQISGSTPGFNWIAGAYFFKERGDNTAATPDLLGFFNASTPTSSYERARNRSFSLFASGTKTLDFLSDALSLTVGGRYTWDDRAATFGLRNRVSTPTEVCALAPTSGTFTDYNAVFDPAGCTMSMDTSFRNFTYTVSLDWKVAPNKLIYVSHRKGYRSGGFNTRATDPAAYGAFRPETVRDVELGFKGDWRLGSDVRLRTNIAGYYQWYSDIQRLLTYSPCPTCLQQTVVQNAANAHIYGGEAELNIAFGRWLTLYGTAALVRPNYDEFLFQGVDYANTATFGGTVRNQYSAGATLTLPTPESFAKTNVQVNWYKQSSFYNQDAITSIPAARVPGFSVTNARIEFANIGGTELTVGASVNNLFDKKYMRSIYSLYDQMGFTSGQYAPPRTWTMDMRFKF